MKPTLRSVSWLVVLALWSVGTLFAAQAERAFDLSVAQVRELLTGIQQAIGEARLRGDDLTEERTGARAEIQKLWALGRTNPASEAGKLATEEAIHQLVHLGRYTEAYDKVDLLVPGEPAWSRILEVLLEAGELSGDYSAGIEHALSRLDRELTPDERTHALSVLGSAYKASGRTDEAIATFRKVVAETPETPRGQRARGHAHELINLNPGQPAPLFEAPSLAGDSVALDDFRGRVVLMSVWASW